MDETSPLLRAKAYDEPSVFEPLNLLREGRRQRHRPDIAVPAVCLLDPDGDIVRHLTATGQATEHPGWACYHTTLWTFDLAGTEVGVIGCAVGASFAVLVAEQLAVSGCELLVSVTSSGSITAVADPPYFVIIDRALRDEGTSHHYLPRDDWSHAPASLLDRVRDIDGLTQQVVVGPTWTTDAPYRETPTASVTRRPLVWSQSRWKPQRSTPTPPPAAVTCSASPTSPTPWPPSATTSRRARPTAPTPRSNSSAR